MRLLITTQSLDRQDSVLGFFHRWVEEFAKHCDSIEIICLRASDYSLPPHVHVHSLGKERGGGRLMRWVRAFWLIISLRSKYDSVFVHMNPEYLLLAGWFWRLWGKKTVLWYAHKSVNIKLRVAVRFANAVLTASKESFRLASSKVRIMGHGIDIDFFTPDSSVKRGTHYLSVGRLSRSKRHDLAIYRAYNDQRGLRIAGEGSERKNLEVLAHNLGVQVTFLGGFNQTQLLHEYRQAALFVHRSETGSLDKVVLEALACGLPVDTSDPALKKYESESPSYVRDNHSLQKLIPRIVHEIATI
jgi:glycosyltransferase involved in cell wall biosynthesis